MYTECPECKTAFRLSASILKAAQGRVRCGGCGSTFNALDNLSEDLPDDDPSSTQTAHIFEEQSQALLETLDELAGPQDIRIEDTGVEWRVLDVEEDGDNDNSADAVDPDATGTIQWSLEESGDDSLDETARHSLHDDEDDDTPADSESTTSEPAGEAADAVVDAEDGESPEVQPDTSPAAADAEEPAAMETAGVATDDTADEAGEAEPKNEIRYDDHTPLPDEFYRPVSDEMLQAIEDEEDADGAATPAPAAEDAAPAGSEQQQVDLEFGDDEDDWLDLLGEVDTDAPAAPAVAAADDEQSADATAEDDAVTASVNDDELSLAATGDYRSAATGDDDAQADAVEDAGSSGVAAADTAGSSENAGGEPPADADARQAVAAETGTDENDDVQTGSEARGDADEDAQHDTAADEAAALEMSAEMEIDAALMQAAAEESGLDAAPTGEADEADEADEAENDDDKAAADGDTDDDLAAAGGVDADDGDDADEADPSDSMLVESIIMEGDTVTGLEIDAEVASYDDIPPPPDDDDEDERGSGRRIAMIAAVVVLGLALAAQLVHANRASLATLDAFENTLGPVYRALGQSVIPAWDVRGWRFETTSGSTDGDDRHLTIVSRIANRSETALPLPLIHVSLTDRYEDVIGSRVLKPSEYLGGSGSADGLIAAGASFTATVTIDAPAPDATGFKLNVCYPLAGERVRCAIEDFKN